MILKQLFLFLFLSVNRVCSKDQFLVRFVKSYVENEGKPTFLIFNDLCWGKNIEVNLSKEISSIGGRVSSSMETSTKYQYHDLLFIIDLACPRSNELISLALTRNLFRSPYRWLIVTNETKHLNLRLWKYPILVDSDVVLATRIENMITLVEVHKPSPNLSMISTPRGYYNGTLVDVRASRQLFRRRRDVMGHTLTVSNVIQDSNNTRYYLPREDYGKEPNFDPISKLSWMNVRLAFEMLNATPAYIFNNRWGYKVNGQWSGMINDLNTGRADLGTNCALSDISRLSIVSYTDTLAPFTVRFIFRQPPLPYVSNIFSLPFSTSVWVAMSVCAALSTICLYFATRQEAGGIGPTQLANLGDTMLLALSAIGQQGCVMEPKKLSGRVIVFVLFTALMALYAAYSANIVVLLQAPSDSIRTLQQLANAKITLAAFDVDYNHFILKVQDPRDTIRTTIYKRIIPEKGKRQFYSLNDGVERIRKGLFAFHSITDSVYRRIEKTFLEGEKCGLVEVDYLNTFLPYVPVRKDSPYIELFRVAFKQLRESGIKLALEKRMLVPKPRCTSTMSSFSSVGLLEMRPVIILMLYGITGSVAILVLEILFFKWNNKRNSKANHCHLNQSGEIDPNETARASANYSAWTQ